MLKVGDKAPQFSGRDTQGNPVSLADFKGRKLVLYFYPKDNTPGCTAEACDFRDNYHRFISRGYAVVADTDLEILKAYEAWGEKNMYGKKTMGTLRKTYVIDENGVITDIIKKVETKTPTAQILK